MTPPDPPLIETLKHLGVQQLNNLGPAELTEAALAQKEGQLADHGALVCRTGKFTGRSPKNRFFVRDESVEENIWWGKTNQGIEPMYFDRLFEKMKAFLSNKVLYVRDAWLGADPETQISLRVYNTHAWHNLFCYNLFLREPASKDGVQAPKQPFIIIAAPDFQATPQQDGVPDTNFVLINIRQSIVLIGGTGYAGEMKKSMFTLMNYLLPVRHNILPMHCAANVGKNQDTAIFFGLSGTGKTTLSADPSRNLIGDDEHGWANNKVFNFEGGCYAKTIRLSAKNEPDIYHAIRFGAVVENTPFFPNSRNIDFDSEAITENTRAAYPIYHIKGAVVPSQGAVPSNIFFLTADAFGVLPPLSRLRHPQAMYHFISGYTAKVAGTEAGITEPQSVFSACFGAPFLPLHPVRYARLLGEKLKSTHTQTWLVNTGWTGGPYGVGTRISLPHTRALIHAVLQGKLNNVAYQQHPVFGLEMPTTCPELPDKVLNPADTWADKSAYDRMAQELAEKFRKNFEKYLGEAGEDILEGGPL